MKPNPSREDIEAVDSILYDYYRQGCSLVEIAENYRVDMIGVDDELQAALAELDEAADRVVARLKELNDELGLTHAGEI